MVNLLTGKISNRLTNILVVALLILMFLFAVFSVRDDSVTSDEVPYIIAGYSYLTQKNYRLCPEHPPLLKDLAAIPLLFLNLNFPSLDAPLPMINQWVLGIDFLYSLGNNPETILFLSRLPMIFLLLFLAWFLSKWARELAGNFAAIFVLFLFSFSPNFLAHGRLVTLDVGVTLGFVLATYFYLRFLKEPTKKHTVLSGLTLGFALLLKISTLLLIPFFGIITLFFFWLKLSEKKEIIKYLRSIILIGLIALLIIWFVYQFHLWNYPLEQQLEDAEFLLSVYPNIDFLNDLYLSMIKNPFLRPFGQHLFVLLADSNVTFYTSSILPTYLFGKISNQGFWYYFPAAYLIKEPLAFHFLVLISLLASLYFLKKIPIKEWFQSHFTEFSMLIFLLIYWFITFQVSLNIGGIRHLLPTLPFTYILVSLAIKNWLEEIKTINLKKLTTLLISLLLGWYAVSSLSSFPHYLSYFNELAGGSKNGYKYLVDSSLDWGQDLKRLAQWVNEQEIGEIYIDYFGVGETESNEMTIKHYLGERAIPWRGSCWWRWWDFPDPGEFPKRNYLAVSATFLQTDRGTPRSDYYGYWGCYNWLNNYQPIAQIGNSIFVYYIYD